jgi:hypothetical protein
MKHLFALAVLVSIGLGAVPAQDINPFPRPVVNTERLLEWTFKESSAGWSALHDCTVAAEDGVLRLQSSGDDPYLASPPIEFEGPLTVNLRLRCATGGAGQFFWMTSRAPDAAEARSQHFKLIHDGQWHDYSVPLAAEGTVIRLRLDPGEAPGRIDVERMELVRQTLHPLEALSVRVHGHAAELMLTNHGVKPIKLRAGGGSYEMPGHATQVITLNTPGAAPFEARELVVESGGLPPIKREVFFADAALSADWQTLKSAGLALQVAPDGSGARIELEGKLAGFLAPLVIRDGALPKLALDRRGGALHFNGSGIRLDVLVRGSEISVGIQSSEPCEGPVLRALGPLEQGLFAGVEYLAKGERSSSTLDIETEEHIRFAPDPMKVTMPLMAFVTDRASTAMTWQDLSLQPVFATPNFLDGAEGHRAALRGQTIAATIRVRPPEPIEEAILWAVTKRGLPPLPQAPRAAQAQLDLCLKALNGPPLKTDAGWGHCAEPSWGRQPYADHASTIWRLSGQVPELPRLVAGGSHIRNEAAYFLTGRAKEWLQMRAASVQGIISEQQPDGSFRYRGKYQRGHFEDTASGYCAPRAVELLECARLTGNQAGLRAGLKALEFMGDFRDPRGAQTWECPLHTPDILACAYLVHAYLLGYELTGKPEYLERARAWAITGLPFVYQWSCRPTMAYATIAVYGATEWRAPNWMGLPVQWCGYDYAYSLALLAPHDHSLDWKQAATGILLAAEQMQYPDGQYAGCVPDSFNLAEQHRNGPAINPCAIVSLRLRLEGQLDSLGCAIANGHRVVAPFPVALSSNRAVIRGRAGVNYQAVVDGRRVVEINSRGTDEFPVEALNGPALIEPTPKLKP